MPSSRQKKVDMSPLKSKLQLWRRLWWNIWSKLSFFISQRYVINIFLVYMTVLFKVTPVTQAWLDHEWLENFNLILVLSTILYLVTWFWSLFISNKSRNSASGKSSNFCCLNWSCLSKTVMVIYVVLWGAAGHLSHLSWLVFMLSDLFDSLCLIKDHVLCGGWGMSAWDACFSSTWSHHLLKVHTFAWLGIFVNKAILAC